MRHYIKVYSTCYYYFRWFRSPVESSIRHQPWPWLRSQRSWTKHTGCAWLVAKRQQNICWHLIISEENRCLRVSGYSVIFGVKCFSISRWIPVFCSQTHTDKHDHQIIFIHCPVLPCPVLSSCCSPLSVYADVEGVKGFAHIRENIILDWVLLNPQKRNSTHQSIKEDRYQTGLVKTLWKQYINLYLQF